MSRHIQSTYISSCVRDAPSWDPHCSSLDSLSLPPHPLEGPLLSTTISATYTIGLYTSIIHDKISLKNFSMNFPRLPPAPLGYGLIASLSSKAAEAEQSRFTIFPNEPDNREEVSTELGSWFLLLFLYSILKGGAIERKSGGGGDLSW